MTAVIRESSFLSPFSFNRNSKRRKVEKLRKTVEKSGSKGKMIENADVNARKFIFLFFNIKRKRRKPARATITKKAPFENVFNREGVSIFGIALKRENKTGSEKINPFRFFFQIRKAKPKRIGAGLVEER